MVVEFRRRCSTEGLDLLCQKRVHACQAQVCKFGAIVEQRMNALVC